MKENFSESDTRAKLIDPALHKCGWTEDLIRRETTEREIEIVEGKARRKDRGRTDYLLCIKITQNPHPFPIALIEAKKNIEAPDKGITQAKEYARLNNVPFVYSTNGHLFVEYNQFTGLTTGPRTLENFPTPDTLRQHYEQKTGIILNNPISKPLLTPYPGGDASRRYYQDAAIRAVLEKIAQDKKRALLFLATGSGKTHIAVHILKKIADSGQLRKALFICDRDELRTQGHTAFHNIFGNNAAKVTTSNPQKNARILIATYQTLNITGEDKVPKFFLENYPKNYFSHIIIDECHRSAWNKWSIVLTNNPGAIQIGLTATPRSFKGGTKGERQEDEEITANNLKYFGEPVYEYDMAQGIKDGYLPGCEIIKREVNLDILGVTRKDINDLGAVDAITGSVVRTDEVRPIYEAPSFEDILQLPDRVKTMCKDLFEMLLQTGGPYQKTVIFCTRDIHADRVASEINNLYAEWCTKNNQKRCDYYAFKCTAASGGSDYIKDLRGLERSHFIATTVDLITTGVDVPILRNVVFFKYVRSPIAFHQMMGRGSRIHLPTNKLMFRVYDYTNATRLLGKDFIPKPIPPEPPGPPGNPEQIIRVEGFEVHINPAGTYIVTKVGDKLGMVTVEEYSQMISTELLKEAKTIEEFRGLWIDPEKRKTLLENLPDDGPGLRMLRELTKHNDCDLYDVLAEIGYGVAAKNRSERVEALSYKHADWLKKLPKNTSETLLALAGQFKIGGTDELENPHIFNAPDVVKAGGINALKTLGEPKDIITETKKRLFAV